MSPRSFTEDPDLCAQGLFDIWAQNEKPNVFDPDFYWSKGFVPPPALEGAKMVALAVRLLTHTRSHLVLPAMTAVLRYGGSRATRWVGSSSATT